MSKHDETNTEIDSEDLALAEEAALDLEPFVQQGPTPTIAPTIGKLDKILSRLSHCDVCGGRLHFNYISDFSRNTTHEKSSCPECNLDSRQVLHRLQ